MTRITALFLALTFIGLAQNKGPVWTPDEQRIVDRLKLRALPDDQRAVVTRELALEIRKLPSSANKLRLASGLASLATEGDFGRDTLQQVTTTLEKALAEQPSDKAGAVHEHLAQLVRYEGVKADLSAPIFTEVKKQLEAADAARSAAQVELSDLTGKRWSLASLKGKVVLVNFWATWCPPCRKEMPDLEALTQQFGPKGFVVLAISDEERAKVDPFLVGKSYTFPVLLDPEGKTGKAFRVEGIPKSFLFDRSGKLVAQAMDMRTRGQFLEMLSKAGLK